MRKQQIQSGSSHFSGSCLNSQEVVSKKKNRIKQISAQTGGVKPIQEVEIAELALQFTAQPQACH